jgi:tRNA threonylcarbamoyladenosine biosynthesis protein TsaB
VLVAAIDTATPTLSLALCEVDAGTVRVLAEAREEAARGGHGGRLPGALVELLAARGGTTADVGAWVCGLGPGSFTGLRIGLATWKGLAYAHRRPLVGASSLAAMALEAAPLAAPGATLVPLLDAKKGEVYAGFFRAAREAVEPLAPEAALAPEALAERVRATPGAVVLGHGVAAYPALGALPSLAGAPRTPSAAALVRAVAGALAGAAYHAETVFALEPHYVRASEAEVKFPHGLGPGATRP